MKQIAYLFIYAIFGLFVAFLTDINNINDSDTYLTSVTALLAIGLYASTSSIEIYNLKQNLTIVISAITVGVLIKILFIGSVLYFITGEEVYLLLGVIVAQIDPLSVASLMKNSRLSGRTKAILASWSSFDDPITVIASIYVGIFLSRSFEGTSLFMGYISDMSINLLFSVIIFLLYKLFKKFILLQYLLLIISICISIYFSMMLSIAIIGLFLRPNLEKILTKVVTIALYTSSFLLGLLLINGVLLSKGLLLAFAAVISQILTGMLLTRKLLIRERIHVSFAQQNGITAIILSLLFESSFPGTISIVAPAILAINIIHAITTYLIDKIDSRWFDKEDSPSKQDTGIESN